MSARSSGSSMSTGLATRSRSSTTRSTVSHTSPRPRGGNEPPIATSAIPKAGNTPPGIEPERRGGGDERLDRDRIDRLGAGQRERERRQVEALGRAGSARVASTQAKLGPAVAVPRQSEIHCIQLPRVGHEVLRRRLHQVDAASSSGWRGSRRGPCRGTAAATTPSRRPRSSSAASQQASMLADSTRSGIITPFGSLVEPLVYCRMTSRSGSGGGSSRRRRSARPGAPGSTPLIGSIGGSPGAGA